MIIIFALATLIGLSLGLLGGGGSILAVPVLTYGAGIGAKEAIATSLLVVGTTSIFALIQHARRGNVEWRTGAVFALTAMVDVHRSSGAAGQ
ncbi:MAG: TSUP family transporter, partial [Myxococcota bacterium]|nr:TSUP family transporter [Myxococcota bacterium]